MNKLMFTTAIVAVTSFGAYAQTTDTTTDQTTSEDTQVVPAFLVSDFTGKNLSTLDIDEARDLRDSATADDRSSWDQTRMRWESGQTFTANRDRWENIGDIGDIVMTADGEIHGVLIDVGGFLGMGTRTVMVDLDHLYFVVDGDGTSGGWFSDTADDFFIVAAMTQTELEGLPEFDADQLRSGLERRGYEDRRHEPGATMGHDGQTEQREGRDASVTEQQAQDQQAMQEDQQARTQAPEGYEMMARDQQTADALIGADVYDGENQQIGTVQDLVLDGHDVSHLVLDIGGFLGLGEHRVALPVQEVDIFWSDQDTDVRVQVPMTKDQLEQLPEHDA